MSKRLLIIISVVAFCGWMSAMNASAYVRIQTPGGIPVKWTTAPGWEYNHNGFTQLSASQMTQIITSAFAAWGAPSCSGIKAQFIGTTTLRWDQTDRHNVLIWNSAIPSQQFPTALALTIPNYTAQGAMGDADIIFNSSYSWSPNPTNQQYDVVGTTVHELGHFLGLAHTNISNATMFPTANPGLCPCRQLKQDDIDGICAIYPGSGGTKPKVGEKCDDNTPCDTNLICVAVRQGDTSGICFESCAAGACPNGEACMGLTSGARVCACQNDNECPQGKKCQNFRCFGSAGTKQLNESCDAQNLCASGLFCIGAPNAPSGICKSACGAGVTCTDGNPCNSIGNGNSVCACQNDTECKGGNKCVNFGCTADNTGGGEDQPCRADGSCQTGLTCIKNPQNQQSICAKVCQNAVTCPAGKVCDPQLGACVPGVLQGRGQPCDQQKLCQSGLFCAALQGGGVCYPICSAQAPCQGGEKCVQVSGSTTSVCACQTNAECPTGKSCQANQCVAGSACTDNTQCTAGMSCVGGQCTNSSQSCQLDGDCPGGQLCQVGKCVSSGGCTSNTECSTGQICQGGLCIPQPQGGCNPACGLGFVCQNGACVTEDQCTKNEDCHLGQECVSGLCRAKTVPEQGPEQTKGCACDVELDRSSGLSLGLVSLLVLLGLGWSRRREKEHF